jgi:hypothetical protein
MGIICYMSTVWNTKYGPRRVRHDPPTLKEAITAARGLTDDLQQQAEIAAALMDVPVEDVRAELMKQAPPRNSTQIVTASGREGAARTVIVERKPSRRFTAGNGAVKAGKPEQDRPGPEKTQGSRISLGHDLQDPQERKPVIR